MPNSEANLQGSSASRSGGETTATALFSLLGRALVTFVFFVSVPAHFGPVDLRYAMAAGVPMAKVVVPATGLLALIGSISVLLGYRARLGAWLLVLFLVPVTLTMHQFWSAKDAMMAQLQWGMFIRNLAIIGAALMITQFGPGSWSLDALRKSRR
ncbi:MAG: DoxX family protein [Acidobacteriia bacterium]|nr:DoxX family protein [Terriglobia bacterium]